MSYIDQSMKKVIAEQVKPILAKHGLKGTLSVQHYSKLTLNISSGKIDFIGNFKTNLNSKPSGRYRYVGFDEFHPEYIHVNNYYFKEEFSGEALEALTELYSAMKTSDWKEEADYTTDYFNISYYIQINIGKYDSPYRLIPA